MAKHSLTEVFDTQCSVTCSCSTLHTTETSSLLHNTMALRTNCPVKSQSGCPWHCVTLSWMYTVISCCVLNNVFAVCALWHRSHREAVCLAMTVNMIRNLSVLCKHGFVCSELCASWLLASSTNDSYANEHHSELLAALGATVIPPIYSYLLAFPTLCPAFLPPCLLFVPLSHPCLSFCPCMESVHCSTEAADETQS